MITRWTVVVLLLFILPLPTQAVLLYNEAALESWAKGTPKGGKETRQEAVKGNLDDFILKRLTPQERDSVRGVQLKFPLYHEDPLQFYSIPGDRTIYLPVQSIKFYDELCIAAAWLLHKNYSLESIGYYMSMFKYKPGANFPPPLKALQIPDNALKDPWVDEYSLMLFNYGVVFIMAHELGHIVYHHTRQTDVIKSQDQERQADNFAIDIFRRQRTVPPIFVYFQAATFYTKNPGDFSSDAEWRTYMNRKQDHPFTADRLHSLAAELRNQPEVFSAKDPEKTVRMVRGIATQIDGIARILEDGEFQRVVTKACRTLDMDTLFRPRRVGEPIPIAPQE